MISYQKSYIFKLMQKSFQFLIKTKFYIVFLLFCFSMLSLASLEDSSLNKRVSQEKQPITQAQINSINNNKNRNRDKTSNSTISFKIPTNKSTDTNSFTETQKLDQFFINNSPLKIHNTALNLLKNNYKSPAILLLKRNFYQNLFPSSYLVLNQLEERVSFFPIFLIISLIITSLVCFIFFILYLKSSSSFFFTPLVSSLTVFFLLLAGNFFLLKNKVCPLTEVNLKLAPVESAPNIDQIPPLTELIILKKTEKWIKIKNPQEEIGWILKKELFEIF